VPYFIMAQAMRTVLFAKATAATLEWRCVAMRMTHQLSRSSFVLAVRIMARAP